MKIEVTFFEEQPDGSANIELELDDEAKKAFIQLGFEAAILNKVKEILDDQL